MENIDGVSVIILKGRLNISTTSSLEEVFNKLFDEGSKKIVVECRELEYISSAGLRALLSAAKRFKKISGEISLSSLTPSVKQVFEISGFTSIFPIYSTQDEALKFLK